VERGILITVSAPSGAGKHTIIQAAMKDLPGLEYAVSATTRDPRPGESDGKDYHFFSPDDFRKRVAAGEFVEWAEVHGNLYGTLRTELDRRLASGKDILVQLDVQGVRNLKANGIDFASVFIMPPSLDELRSRLVARGADNIEDIGIRLQNASAEMAARGEYDYVVVNGDLETAIQDFESIIRAERCKEHRNT
jgi:guanylate kinase